MVQLNVSIEVLLELAHTVSNIESAPRIIKQLLKIIILRRLQLPAIEFLSLVFINNMARLARCDIPSVLVDGASSLINELILIVLDNFGSTVVSVVEVAHNPVSIEIMLLNTEWSW